MGVGKQLKKNSNREEFDEESEDSVTNFINEADDDSDVEEEEDVEKNPNVKQYSPFTRRRKAIRRVLHSREFHITSIALVVIDCIVVLAEIVLDLYLKDEGEHGSHGPHQVTVHEVLPYVSLSLLSLFVVERFVKVIVDSHHFFTHKMEIFDFVVVVGSFVVDVAVLSSAKNEAYSALGLLVILRLWRVVRIANGIIVSVKKTADKRVKAVKVQNKELEGKIDDLHRIIKDKNTQITELKELLLKNGVKFDERRFEIKEEIVITNEKAKEKK